MVFETIKQEGGIPKSFNEARSDEGWDETIDIEFVALLKREAWKLIPIEPNMDPFPYTWKLK